MRDESLALYSIPKTEFEHVVRFLENLMTVYTEVILALLVLTLIGVLWCSVSEMGRSSSGIIDSSPRRRKDEASSCGSEYNRLSLDNSSSC